MKTLTDLGIYECRQGDYGRQFIVSREAFFQPMLLGTSVVPVDVREYFEERARRGGVCADELLNFTHYSCLDPVSLLDVRPEDRSCILMFPVLVDVRRTEEGVIRAILQWHISYAVGPTKLGYGAIQLTEAETDIIFEKVRLVFYEERRNELLPDALKAAKLDSASIEELRAQLLASNELDDASVTSRRQTVAQQLLADLVAKRQK